MVVLSALALIAGATAIARADSPIPGGPDVSSDPTAGPPVDPNPCPTVNSNVGNGACDTDYTPVAKDGNSTGLFKQVGGAEWRSSGTPPMVDGSFTPITVDFYAVRFLDQNNGFAGGAACADDTPFDQLDPDSPNACTRVPVIWQYTNKPGEGPLWREVYRGDTEGFVAAIAYYGRGKALAVGGTGKYPYREFSKDSTSNPDDDPSGKGRVWETDPSIFGDSDWHEYGPDQKPTAPNLPADLGPVNPQQSAQQVVGPETDSNTYRSAKAIAQAEEKAVGAPDAFGPAEAAINSVKPPVAQTPMRALTALDCVAVDKYCVAGGIQQLFMWHSGHFDKSYGNGSPDTVIGSTVDSATATASGKSEMVGAANFRFRVRQLAFLPGSYGQGLEHVAGVTAGCCDKVAANNAARVLVWDGYRWVLRGLNVSLDRAAQTIPDSFYALVPTGPKAGSLLATNGGPAQRLEPASHVVGGVPLDGCDNCSGTTTGSYSNEVNANANCAGGLLGVQGKCTDLEGEALHPQLADFRLVAGDGDASGVPRSSADLGSSNLGALGSYGEASHGDGFMDWAVGERRSTHQAIAYMTFARSPTGPVVPSPLNCDTYQIDQSCQPASQAEVGNRVVSQSYFLLPSYRLNAFTMVGSTGTGWAAGDKGALVRLGGGSDDGAVTQEPKPPRVGPPRAASSPASSYSGQPPSTGSPGRLPVLGDQTEKTRERQFVPAGSPQTFRYGGLKRDDVASIVMSRDGSEGWAVGSGDNPTGGSADLSGTTLYHYSGGRWSVCDPQGIPDEVDPDPPCASLLPLYRYVTHDFEPIRIIEAARVPLENDNDPANDNEFEVMAIGTEYLPPHSRLPAPAPAVLIYKDGRWSVDEHQMGELADLGGFRIHAQDPVWDHPVSLGFSAPNDGWLVDNYNGIHHFDGRDWRWCNSPTAQRAACDDDPAAPRLPDAYDPGQSGTGNAKRPEFFQPVGQRLYLFGGGHWNGGPAYPFILYKDPGGQWTDGSGPGGDGLGYDPGCASRDGADTNGDGKPDPGNCVADPNAAPGTIASFSIATNRDGSTSGWATGDGQAAALPLPAQVGALLSRAGIKKIDTSALPNNYAGFMLHLEKDAGGHHIWHQWGAHDATQDYPKELYHDNLLDTPEPELLSFPGENGDGPALLLPSTNSQFSQGPMLWFNPAHSRWEVMPTPFELSSNKNHEFGPQARARAIVPDGGGGAWIAIRRMEASPFSPESPQGSTFFYRYTDQVPKPVFTDAPDPVGTRVITGAAGGGDGSFWLATDSGTVYHYDRVLGWDALAIPNWDPGRIVARVSSANAIAIGADGNGVVVGDGGRIADVGPGGAIIDQAAGRSCARGDTPPCGTGRDLTAAAVSPQGGAMVGGQFRTVLWRPEGGVFRAVEKPPAALTATITGVSMPNENRAWLCDDHGEVFEGELQGQDWKWKLENDTSDGAILNQTLQGVNGEAGTDVRLRAIALDAEGRGYAVGEKGIVLERDGDGAHPWHRIADVPVSTYTAVAISPSGFGAGAMIGGEYGLVLTKAGGRLAIAHQADPYDGVNTSHVDWGRGASQIAGMALLPGRRAGELEAWAAEQLNPEQAVKRVPPNALLHYSSDPGDPLLDGAGPRGTALEDSAPRQTGEVALAAFGKSECIESGATCPPPTGTMRENDRILAGIRAGLQDSAVDAALSTGDSVQRATADQNQPGENPPAGLSVDDTNGSVIHRDWETSFARPLLDSGTPLFGAIGGQDLAAAQNNYLALPRGTSIGWRMALADMPAPWGEGGSAPSANRISWVPVEDTSKKTATDETQAHTHYAVDGVKDGHKVLRLVVADTSRGSLTASDAMQNPPEEQTAWLDSALCIKGSQTDAGSCTREPGEKAVLLTNTPTYSYGPGATSDINSQDGLQIEALAFTDHVTAVIQGKLGWNGLYWTSTQGVHAPQPGGTYPDSPPAAVNGQSPIPFVIASSAGGAFAQDAQDTSASNGYWHGYTVVRLSPDGDPAETIVEQRPILDWLLIQGKSHMLRPGQSLKLDGFGREPMSTDAAFKYDEISSPAVTHRYDLIYADPDKPWLPKQGDVTDACDPYDCLPTDVGQIDPVSGKVDAGSGGQERTYALALLSVGKLSTTYPISFEPRPSFRQAPAPPPLPIPPAATPPPAPAPPAPAPPFNPPTLATPPPLAPLPAQTPPVPPAPPAPPGAGPAQLDLFTSPPVLSVAPTISLFPPSPPVINVAPPTPARPVEKAKKVAVQSSGSDSDASQKSEIQQAGGDLAQGGDQIGGTSASTRYENNFTAIAHRDQASAWARDLQWGGGLTLMALVAAFGWITVRPTPRRRQPEVPAPSRAGARWR